MPAEVQKYMEFTWIALSVLILINIAVSLFLFKRDDLENFQKYAQILIVWLIPFLAAIGLWLFHRNSDQDGGKRIQPGGGHNDSNSTDAGMRN